MSKQRIGTLFAHSSKTVWQYTSDEENELDAMSNFRNDGIPAENFLPVWYTIQMTGVPAENSLSVWQTVQMTGSTAENCLRAWQALLLR
jgi:hypothetical protein